MKHAGAYRLHCILLFPSGSSGHMHASFLTYSLNQFVTDRCLIKVTLPEDGHRKRYGCFETERNKAMLPTEQKTIRIIRY